ncbi:ABC transporter ATP-binding protein [Staphylococcus caprae]|uniref:ABC transporter ATP-binding protein n=1 Tax=Staphylococcus caprae TaxID=29380 RepID=UPI003B2275F6
MIIIDNLTKTYGNKDALKNISLKVNKNECLGLIGPNGAGKSTLIKCLTNIINYDEGTIRFNNEKLKGQSYKIGYLSQNIEFKRWMTCEGLLNYFGKLSDIEKHELKIRVEEILHKVGLYDKRKLKVEELSGGMKQRLGIAQALIHQPEIVILDEPVSALDPIGRHEIKAMIKEIKKISTLIISTHILEDAAEFCDRFIILKCGEKLGEINKSELGISKNEIHLMTQHSLEKNNLVEIANALGTIEMKENKKYTIKLQKNMEIDEIIYQLNQMNIKLNGIYYKETAIEDLFLEMAGDK